MGVQDRFRAARLGTRWKYEYRNAKSETDPKDLTFRLQTGALLGAARPFLRAGGSILQQLGSVLRVWDLRFPATFRCAADGIWRNVVARTVIGCDGGG